MSYTELYIRYAVKIKGGLAAYANRDENLGRSRPDVRRAAAAADRAPAARA
jgi:hypothetical protein